MDIRPTIGDSSWFTQARFGMFIHWGLYAQAARHEWVMHTEGIPVPEYERRYFKRFDPDLYDPNQWAAVAAEAGMKYFVVTTKHHEGFCLWDSKLTDYKATNTAAGRDLLRPMVDAFRARNLRVGFYHSLIDWHHPENLIDKHIGPYRNADLAALNKNRTQAKYADYLHGQVRELLTQFGKIDILWFDFSYPQLGEGGKGKEHWNSQVLYNMVRQLQPHVILDDRLDLPDGWDIKTPEQSRPREWVKVDGQPVVWEACNTFSGAWGYARDEMAWKSVDQLVLMLVDSVSRGGNLLLNVGPTGRGDFDERALDRLGGMGAWMKRHSRSIYGCTQAPAEYAQPEDCRLTWNPTTRRLYVHVLAWPFKDLFLDHLAGKVEYAQLLNDASELKMTEPADDYAKEHQTLTLSLPTIKPNVTIPVVELFMK